MQTRLAGASVRLCKTKSAACCKLPAVSLRRLTGLQACMGSCLSNELCGQICGALKQSDKELEPLLVWGLLRGPFVT